MSKEKLRKAIARQVKEYLARGGVIEQVPRVIFCPPGMSWIRDRGWDYTPWSHYGDPIALGKDGYERLGDNNYYRPPSPTEE